MRTPAITTTMQSQHMTSKGEFPSLRHTKTVTETYTINEQINANAATYMDSCKNRIIMLLKDVCSASTQKKNPKSLTQKLKSATNSNRIRLVAAC